MGIEQAKAEFPLITSTREPGLIRESFEGAGALLPECPMLGWSRFDRAAYDLGAHVHSGSYEICYIVRGKVEWWAGSQIFQVGPRDVYITRPGEVHGGLDAFMHPCELYWVQVRPSNLLYRELERLQHRHFAAGPVLAMHFERLLAEHRSAATSGKDAKTAGTSTRDKSDAATIAARAALRLLLIDTLRFHEVAVREENALATPSPPILAAMQLLHRRFERDDCLKSAIVASGLAGTQFRKRFLAETGFTPHDYLMRAQVEAAKKRLVETSLPVTEIAFEIGFSSSQYFATAFRKLVGLSPLEYRRRRSRPLQ